MTQHFLNLLGSESVGYIINITSAGGVFFTPGPDSYGMCKLLELQMQRYLAASSPNVIATALHPGAILTNITAPEFVALFHENIELKYKAPKGIVSDQDTRITSKFWAEVCIYSLIKRRISTAFHPQTDGQTEILNQILENYLQAYTSLEQMN